jgi:hypothetical protein
MGKRERGEVAAANLIKFNFHGDELDVVEKDGEYWVDLHRLCEPLGLQPHGQMEKLKAAPWATTQIICAVAQDGKIREVFCLSLRSVAGWLFSVNAGKVRPALRAKLVRYQRECADVLADHFLGRRGALPAGAADAEGVRRLHIDYATKLSAMQAECRDLRQQRDQALAASSALIAEQDLKTIRSELDRVSHLMLVLGRCRKPNMASARQTVRNRVLSRWLGAGKKLDGMPRELVAEVLAGLNVMKREYEAELKRRGPASQTTIYDVIRRHSVN